jgi:hypothetical protein
MGKDEISKNLVREILEELHILTALSPIKLLTLFKEANEQVASKHKITFPNKGLSIPALYRNNKNSKPIGLEKSIRELKGKNVSTLKKGEGQLRLRIVEIPIRYYKRADNQNYEVLRFLCSYEVRTGDFDYLKLASNVLEITEKVIMDYVMKKQKQLEIAITCVFFTQTFFPDQYPITFWDYGTISRVGLQAYSSKITELEQINFPARNHPFEIYGTVKEKSNFEEVFDALVKSYRKNLIQTERYKACYADRKFRETYDAFSDRIEAYIEYTQRQIKINPYFDKRTTGGNTIYFNFKLSNKNTQSLIKTVEQQQEAELKRICQKFRLPYSGIKKGHIPNASYPEIWNFQYENEVTGIYLKTDSYSDPHDGHLTQFLEIKLESDKNMYVFLDSYLDAAIKTYDLRKNDSISITYFSGKHLPESKRYHILIQDSGFSSMA